jgi:hypothetical protein
MEVTRNFRKDILAVYQVYENLYVKDMVTEQWKTAMDYAIWKYQNERYQEIEGIALALDVPTKRVLVMSYLYEYMAYCTSIVAKQENGTLVHLRIFDSTA